MEDTRTAEWESPVTEEPPVTENNAPVGEEIPTEETPAAEETPGDGGEFPTPDYQRMAEEDLAALRAAVPELAGLSSLAELSDVSRYGALREAGLSPVEAYCAMHAKRLLQGRTGDNRAHLAPSMGRTTSAVGAHLSARELDEARALFPSLSDREIEGLYRRVRGQGSH